MKKLLTHLLIFAAVIGAHVGLLAPAAYAAAGPAPVYVAQTKTDICNGVALTGSGCNTSASNSSIQRLVTTIIRILSIIVGVVAVIMIVIGGLKYITSGGDASKVASAKNTIIYALVGLIIVALAQFIVSFVLGNVG